MQIFICPCPYNGLCAFRLQIRLHCFIKLIQILISIFICKCFEIFQYIRQQLPDLLCCQLNISALFYDLTDIIGNDLSGIICVQIIHKICSQTRIICLRMFLCIILISLQKLYGNLLHLILGCVKLYISHKILQFQLWHSRQFPCHLPCICT